MDERIRRKSKCECRRNGRLSASHRKFRQRGLFLWWRLLLWSRSACERWRRAVCRHQLCGQVGTGLSPISPWLIAPPVRKCSANLTMMFKNSCLCFEIAAQRESSATNLSRTLLSLSNFSKYAIVQINPSFRGVRGCQDKSSCAREISGRRCRGRFAVVADERYGTGSLLYQGPWSLVAGSKIRLDCRY